MKRTRTSIFTSDLRQSRVLPICICAFTIDLKLIPNPFIFLVLRALYYSIFLLLFLTFLTNDSFHSLSFSELFALVSSLGQLSWSLGASSLLWPLHAFTQICLTHNRTQLLAEGPWNHPQSPAPPASLTLTPSVWVEVRVQINCNMRQIKCDPVRGC